MNIQMFKKKLIWGYIGKSGIIHQKDSIYAFWCNCQPLLLRIKLGLLHIHFFFSITCPSTVQIFCTCFLFPEGIISENKIKSCCQLQRSERQDPWTSTIAIIRHMKQMEKVMVVWEKQAITLNMNFHPQELVLERFQNIVFGNNFQKWFSFSTIS